MGWAVFTENNMAVLKKILIGTGILAGGYIIYKIATASAEANAFVTNLNFNIKPSGIKLSGTNLVVKIDVEFINPTNTSVSFRKPMVTISYRGSTLAQSKVSTDIVTIQPNGVSRIKDITFNIPLTNLSILSSVIDMVKTVKSDIKIDQNATLVQKLSQLASGLSSNAITKLLPLLEVSMLVYVSDIPIPYSTKLG